MCESNLKELVRIRRCMGRRKEGIVEYNLFNCIEDLAGVIERGRLHYDLFIIDAAMVQTDAELFERFKKRCTEALFVFLFDAVEMEVAGIDSIEILDRIRKPVTDEKLTYMLKKANLRFQPEA